MSYPISSPNPKTDTEVKKLILDNTSFRYLEESFKEWLDILGYAPSTVYNLPHHIREFLSHLEKREITKIDQLTHQHIIQYYDKLKERSNQRRSGALSNAYLNKHQQALKRFTDYLRQVGRLASDGKTIRKKKSQYSQYQKSNNSIKPPMIQHSTTANA